MFFLTYFPFSSCHYIVRSHTFLCLFFIFVCPSKTVETARSALFGSTLQLIKQQSQYCMTTDKGVICKIFPTTCLSCFCVEQLDTFSCVLWCKVHLYDTEKEERGQRASVVQDLDSLASAPAWRKYKSSNAIVNQQQTQSRGMLTTVFSLLAMLTDISLTETAGCCVLCGSLALNAGCSGTLHCFNWAGWKFLTAAWPYSK